MSKHTPGPWIHEGQFYVRIGDGSLSTQITGRPGSLVSERDANARLISAAPDLLEALIRCQNSLQRLLEQHGSPWEADHLASRDSTAAIAKAEGGKL